MNTKTFAQKARNILMNGVAKKLLYWGFDPNGQVLESPEAISGGYSFRGEVYDDPNVPELYKSLSSAVRKKGIDVIVEEAAYTWFNRIMAIRILAKNGYDLPQLEFAEGLRYTPVILQKARQGQYSFLSKEEQIRLQQIIGDYNKENEAFGLLLISYCHSHNTLNKVFGRIGDYTELLLPDDMLKEQGFLNLLNTTDAISNEEYEKVELIGWLYQFYISQRKDEVFASFRKRKKAEAKDIPAATQIFTPNWIVKYMVENTAGKIWLDLHPDSILKSRMKYFVVNGEDQDSKSIISNVEDLTLMDPACGSGHILVEGFELLYQMYLEEYYTPEEAVESILTKNLFGLDIDNRATQLATFAILLKAAKVYPDIWDKNWEINIYAMPEANSFNNQEVVDFLGDEGAKYIKDLEKTLQLMQDAKNLGSVMQLKLNQEAISFIEQRYQDLKQDNYLNIHQKAILHKASRFIPVLLTLGKDYKAVVANPPYLKQQNMNSGLKKYVTDHYSMTKSDLFAVFMELALRMTEKNGKMGMINQHSWMFLSSFENLRKYILKNYGISSMLHLGPRTFEEISGEVVQSTAFIIDKLNNNVGIYHRLVNYNNIRDKEKAFLSGSDLYQNIPKKNFFKIPGHRIGYWLSDLFLSVFENDTLGAIYEPKSGVLTGKDPLFVRNWYETSIKKIGFNIETHDQMLRENFKWIPITNGGAFRKWYGNLYNVVNLKNNGEDIKCLPKNNHRLRNPKYYFLKGINWTLFMSGKFCVRESPHTVLFGNGSRTFFPSEDDFEYLMCLFNSTVARLILELYNPTTNFVNEDISSVPIIYVSQRNDIHRIYEILYDIAKKDWNSAETSWSFSQSPLLIESTTLEEAFRSWENDVTHDFVKMHNNEEELNRIFIQIYGLEDELTPEVPLKDITILQEEVNQKELENLEPTFRGLSADAFKLPIDKSKVIQQFISYGIGLFMGRYRLDKRGLNIAHPNPNKEESLSYTYKKEHITIDEDAIVPLMGSKANFKDDALYQIQRLLDTIWGKDTRTENLNFLQDGLNKDLEKYMVKDFWKYHCKMYNKKPIYWLFSSKKGAFQVLVYMHRMNAFTVEKIRANYLLEHLKFLNSEINAMEKEENNLTTQQARKLEQMRQDFEECQEYDMHLKDIADRQIKFDLDDGVTENYKLFEGVVAKIK